jgi:hypothetical protein
MAAVGRVWYNFGHAMAHQLHVLSGKKQGFVLDVGDGDVVDVGNRKTAKLSIRDPWISWNHAKITAEAGGKFFVEDVGSSNGTWVNGEKVKRRELKANDVIHFGKTKVKFAGLAAAGAPAPDAPAAAGAAKPAGDAPWWDKVIESGAPPAGGGGGGATEVQLHEERRMRQALEKFLDLPKGASVGEVARAGALEARVRELEAQLEAARKAAETAKAAPAAPGGDAEALERAERARQELTKKVVELESNAAASETRTVDLERRLKEMAESNKKEVTRARERHDAELAALRTDLEQERSASKAQGGDAALQAVRSQAEALSAEVSALREKLRAAEQKVDDQAREFENTRALDGGSVEALRSALEASKAEALHWREEHAKVVQEIDEISMEQIEIEDGLKARIVELEAAGDAARDEVASE